MVINLQWPKDSFYAGIVLITLPLPRDCSFVMELPELLVCQHRNGSVMIKVHARTS